MKKLILIEFHLLVLCCFNVCSTTPQVTCSMSWFHLVWPVSPAFSKTSPRKTLVLFGEEATKLKFSKCTLQPHLCPLPQKAHFWSLPVKACLFPFDVLNNFAQVHTKLPLLRPNLVAVLESIFIRTIVKFCSMSK